MVFSINDTSVGSGPDALPSKTLFNLATGESFQIVHSWGGKTESLRLVSPATGKLRDVLQTHDGNATALRLGPHYAGAILLPFANRIRNGTYSFYGKTHHLPRNECVPGGPRCDALHGFLYNRPLSVIKEVTTATSASVTLAYPFDGTTTPGWPFRAYIELTYKLSAASAAGGAGTATVRTVATNTHPTDALPFFNSWHPYFKVADVAAARIELDGCAPPGLPSGGWRHVVMGAGAPRLGDLIPTGHSEPWTKFDGTNPIGGMPKAPTYYDDEFKSTLPPSAAVTAACGPHFRTRLIDAGGAGDASVLFSDRQHNVVQVFSGAKETWGWDAVAIEPMSALADAFNNGDGVHVLSAGESFDATYGVTLDAGAAVALRTPPPPTTAAAAPLAAAGAGAAALAAAAALLVALVLVLVGRRRRAARRAERGPMAAARCSSPYEKMVP